MIPGDYDGFNPRPSLLTDEASSIFGWINRDTGFNPRPSLLTDEAGVCRGGVVHVDCFNPRPSLLTDEALQEAVDAMHRLDVSTHIRHC